MALLLPILFLNWTVPVSKAMAEPPSPPVSGYELATETIQRMQDDPFANPASFWLERGEALFAEPAGAADRSCADCHGVDGLKGAATRYPAVVEGRLMNLEARINQCRTARMAAAPLPLESEDLLALAVFVRHRSEGLPLRVAVNGPALAWFERGRALYTERRGQMNLACFQCHDERVGRWLRGEQLSQGQLNGFPAYLLRWSGVGSAHRRFQFCDDQRLAEPLPLGSDDYLALELYVAWRGNGLPVEALAVRR